MPDAVAIPVGNLADPTFPPTRVVVYESPQHPWVRVSGALERYD
ncbi:hypothetical protein [Lysobacter sp. A3-1-A15]